MPAAIKLIRVGKRGKPNYRIVVMDKRKKRTGAYLEKIGYYNPLTNPPVLSFDQDRYDYWLSKGAVISEGIRKLNPRKSAKSANISK